MLTHIQLLTDAAFKELTIMTPIEAKTGKCSECGQDVASVWMSKAKAILFTLAGINVVFTPWLIVAAQFYCITQLHTEFPMAAQILWFCGACIMGLLGMSPWIQEVFGRVAGVSTAKGKSNGT